MRRIRAYFSMIHDVLLGAATILFVASLWQIEILWWCDEHWEAPFFWFKLSRASARDLWYVVISFAFLLAMAAGYTYALGS